MEELMVQQKKSTTSPSPVEQFMARPLIDSSAVSDESSIVMRKRLELDAAVQQHTQRLMQTVEEKDRRIHQLSEFIERLVADFKYNLQVISELQDAVGNERQAASDVTSRLRDVEEEVKQHKAARSLLEIELRRSRQQEESARAELDRVSAELQEQIDRLREQHERDAIRWEDEHRRALAEARSQREADTVASRLMLQEETLRLRNQLDAVRGQLANALEDAKSRSAELERATTLHSERVAAVSLELEACRTAAAAERRRYEESIAALQKQLGQAEQLSHSLTRQIADLESALAATEQRLDQSLRQEAAKLNELQNSLSATQSSQRISQQQLDSAKQTETQLLSKIREVSAEWEAKYHEHCLSSGAALREAEVSRRNAEARAEEHSRALSICQSELGRLQREQDRLQEAYRSLESDHSDTTSRVQQLTERVTRLSAAEAKATAALRACEAKHREDVSTLENEVARLQSEVQRWSREHVAVLQKAKDDTSEVRRQLSTSEAARIALDQTLADLRRQDYPTVVSHLRDEIGQLQSRVALLTDEKNTLLGHVQKITAELTSDPYLQDHQAKSREVERLQNQLTQERTLREAAEATARELRVSIEEREKAYRSRSVSLNRHSSSNRVPRLSSEARESSGDDAEDAQPQQRAADMGSATISRLRRDLAEWRSRCENLEEEVDLTHRERAAAVTEVAQLRHKIELLTRQRDDLTALNARLNHEAKRLRGLSAAEHITMPVAPPPAVKRLVDAAVETVASIAPTAAPADRIRKHAPLSVGGRRLSPQTQDSVTPPERASSSTTGLRRYRGQTIRNYNSFARE